MDFIKQLCIFEVVDLSHLKFTIVPSFKFDSMLLVLVHICLPLPTTSGISLLYSLPFLHPDTQVYPQPPTPQLQQPSLEVLVPGEGKEEILVSAQVRSGGGGGGVVDPMKVEGMGGGAGRQASALPGQGFSKYQKSLPPRFQRQQQVSLITY
jgi:hypothetical protein